MATLISGVEPKPNSPQANHAMVLRRLLDLSFKDTNWDLLDEFVAENVVIHDLGTGQDQVGLASAKENQQSGQDSFQQGHLELHELFASEDRVVIAWTWHLVHVGDYLGIAATGRNVTFAGVHMYRFNDDEKICEIWGSFDRLGPLKQISDVSKEI